jgi:quercetin dioxygenase-like cupin family protein
MLRRSTLQPTITVVTHDRCEPIAGSARPAVRFEQGGTPMQIVRNSIATMPGPSDWFTGTVYIDTVAVPSEPTRLGASSVHFAPGARTAWHIHPNGQTIYVTEGVGLCQRRGGPIEVIRPGDRVFFEPGEEHWHGAIRDRFMTHLAMHQTDDQGNAVSWGEHVTDEEYDVAPQSP